MQVSPNQSRYFLVLVVVDVDAEEEEETNLPQTLDQTLQDSTTTTCNVEPVVVRSLLPHYCQKESPWGKDSEDITTDPKDS